MVVGVRPRVALWALGMGVLLLGAARAGEAPPGDVLATLRAGHPRLILLPADVPRLKEAARADAAMRAWHEGLVREADRTLAADPAVHRLIGPRLLDQSRLVLGRVTLLAGLYRIDGDRRHAERAIREMRAAAAFPDWNPSHFLDTAEMTNALGIGYDWLFDVMSPEDRRAVREAIVAKGLRPGLKVYASGRGWPRADHNWNQVCNGGMTVGALAIADEEPAIARAVIEAARASIPIAMKSFAPDGGWEEGPGYWSYATSYNVYYLEAVRSALGTDFGLGAMPGVAETGRFRMHSIGPVGKTFNFADAGERVGAAPQMFWLAHRFARPAYAAHEREVVSDRGSILHLIYAPRVPPSGGYEGEPTDAAFRAVNVAFLRGAWEDPKTLYVGFKGGDNRANHSHLDLGSFVLDALGERWALDLGGDDYNLPGYFGGRRWEYYRLRTESHNTLTIDDENQDPKAKAPLVRFRASPERAHAVADLSAAYAPSGVTRAWRGVARIGTRGVVIQDEIRADRPVRVKWNFHTDAAVEASGDRATLTRRGGKALTLRVVEPAGAAFVVEACDPPKPQRQQPNVRNVALVLPGVTSARLVVVAEPAGGEPIDVPVEPLERWADDAAKQ
jgi:hypothetical protein